jgi:hypothetical protein
MGPLNAALWRTHTGAFSPPLALASLGLGSRRPLGGILKRGQEHLTRGLPSMRPIAHRWRRSAITEHNRHPVTRSYSLTSKATCQSFAHPQHRHSGPLGT